MRTLTVRTPKEFEKALENRVEKIIFEGSDAERMLREIREAESKKNAARNTSRGLGLGLGLLCLLAFPFTGGASLAGAAAIGSTAALGTAAAVGAATVGVVALSETVWLAIITGAVTLGSKAIEAIRDYQIEKERNRLVFVRK